LRNCETCWHQQDGDCKLGSCTCATAVMEHKEPTRWLSRLEVEEHIKDCKQCQVRLGRDG